MQEGESERTLISWNDKPVVSWHGFNILANFSVQANVANYCKKCGNTLNNEYNLRVLVLLMVFFYLTFGTTVLSASFVCLNPAILGLYHFVQ